MLDLFPTIEAEDVRRPVGKTDLLIGLDYCRLLPDLLIGLDCCRLLPDLLIGLDYYRLLPDEIAEIDKLQLMKGPLGYCLRGSHPQMMYTGNNAGSVNVVVHHTVVTTDDLQINGAESIRDEISKYFTIESMGISNARKCSDCCTTINIDNISIKEEKELEII